MEFVYVLLGLGCGLSLVRADPFQVARRVPKITCSGCTISVATAEIQAKPDFGTAASEATTYIVVTALEIVTDLAEGTTGCSATTESASTLQTPFSFAKPVGTNPNPVSTSAASQLIDFLDFTPCANGASPVVKGLLPQTNSTAPSATSSSPSLTPRASVSSHASDASSTVESLLSTPILNSNSSAASTNPAAKISKSDLTTSDKIAIGIVIPIVVLAALLLAFFILRRHRKRAKSGEDPSSNVLSSDDTQPYLQPKGELDAEEKRRYELHAQDIRYEVNGEDEIHEVAEHQTGDTHGAMEGSVLPKLPRSQELRGEECAKELDESEMKAQHVVVEET